MKRKRLEHSDAHIPLSHEINNPNNSILLDAETLEKVWREVIPMLDERLKKEGDFSIGGCFYSRLREDLIAASRRIIRNSRRIKNVTEGYDKRKKNTSRYNQNTEKELTGMTP